MAVKTRQPTGAVPWPFLLVEGDEKSGKTYSCAKLTGSPRIGRARWLDLAEGAGDEYIKVPGARYQIIDHDGTWKSIIHEVTEAQAEAQADRDAGKLPYLLVIDTGTAEWQMLSNWTNMRARQIDSNKLRLARNPDAEVIVPPNYWNDANSRHQQLMWILMRFPGIVVMTARGKEVSAFDDRGTPVAGTRQYKVEGQKGLAYDASCWVRMYREKPAIIVGARNVDAGIRPGKDEPYKLGPDWDLEWVVFDYLKCDPATARVRSMAELRGMRAAQEILDEAAQATTFARVKQLYAEAVEAYGTEGMAVPPGRDELHPLLPALKWLGDQRQAAERKGAQEAQGEHAWAGGWRKRLAAATTQDEAAALRDEVTKALQDNIITEATAYLLYPEHRTRHGELVTLDPDDPWLLKIRDLADASDAPAVDEEMTAVLSDEASAQRLAALRSVLQARAGELSRPGGQAAAA
jgi:hypothetical protein